jgi:hypothetical protein
MLIASAISKKDSDIFVIEFSTKNKYTGDPHKDQKQIEITTGTTEVHRSS